jgi:hypothetical protein
MMHQLIAVLYECALCQERQEVSEQQTAGQA